MATKVFPISSSSNRAKEPADDHPQIMGKTPMLGLGYHKPFTYAFYIKAAIDALEWSDVKQITDAWLYLTIPPDADSLFEFGGPRVSSWFNIGLIKSAFPDNDKTTFTKGDYSTPTYKPTPAYSNKHWTASTAANTTQRFNVRAYIESIAPENVLTAGGKPGGDHANYGFRLERHPTSAVPDPRLVFASETYPDNSIQPYIQLEYVAKPSVDYVALTAPPVTIAQIEGEFFEGDFIPGTPGEKVYQLHIQVYTASVSADDYDNEGTKAKWQQARRASGSETQTNHFVTPLPAQLKSAATYRWRARAQSSGGPYSGWSPVSTFTLQTDNPSLSGGSPAGSYKTLNGVRFKASYSDPNRNTVASYRIQVRDQIANTDPAWDDGPFYWDTSDRTASQAEKTWLVDRAGASYQQLQLLYGGDALGPGTYSWRIKARDSYGAESAWLYGGFTVTVGEEPDPGDTEFLTGYARRQVRNRILIRSMKDSAGVRYADRRPGGIVAIIEDAANIGASEYYNSGGEFYFTLPAIHPQVGVIEPWQVHYALEQYRGQGWTEVAAGLITDFDASDDDVIFYGQDYLAILGQLVDERFNAASADAKAVLWPAEGTGAKYVDQTIKVIVTDQLDRAIHGADSPLAFITRGTIAAMNEKVTLFATFKSRLSFIGGLLDSHRGTNLGNRTRLRIRKAPGRQYSFVVEDNPGQDRPNLRMEYGGLVQGMRVIGFGDWGTRVMAIGQNPNSSKVEYVPNALGLVNETIYGRIPKINIWPDISDKNDLLRRSKLMARQVSKVGKRLALGLRVDALGVKENWDLCDSVPVMIDRGVVETERYGSGLYTILGWAYQVFPDGHTDLTLTLLPKMDAEPPDTDLIPSDPIHATPEWAMKTGKPTPMTYAEIPPDGSSPTYDNIATRTYVDAETAVVYEFDTETGLWVETEELLEGPPGEPGPVGPPGPIGPPGPGGGGSADIDPPPAPVIKSVTSETVQQDDGTPLTNLVATIGYDTPPVGLYDLDEFILQSTRFGQLADPTLPDWSRATQWVSQTADGTGTLDTLVVQPTVLAATAYWVRAFAVDKAGNRQATASNVVQVTTDQDTDAPPAPTGIMVEAGMSTIGLRWDPAEVPDLAYTEIGYRESPAGNWVSVQTAGTLVVLTGLINDQLYDLRLRSVDTSGNTILDPAADPPVTVKATDPDAGWVSGGTIAPTALAGDSLVWTDAMIGELFAGKLNADWITAGTLKVGGLAGTANAIEVYDASGNLIGSWSSDGISILDATNPRYKMAIASSSLYIYDLVDPAHPFPVVSISPLGIDASSITFGSARGGHNLIPNSSFELGEFSATDLRNQVWDVAADWNAAGSRQGADINITTGASSLTVTVI